MTRILASLFLLLIPVMFRGELTIRIFTRARPLTVVFTPSRGSYYLLASSGDSLPVAVNEPVVVTRYDDRVIFKTKSGVSHVADSLVLRPVSDDALFSLRALGKNEPVKLLDGSLRVSSYPGSLLVLNITDVETYLPGVVRAEAGGQGPVEYFRAQAVVARTYAYRNIDRHMLDGYNLCDDTHCQVYPGIIADNIIIDACKSTSNKVLIDRDSLLIISAFHANCGGQTAASSDVWVTAQSYLVPVTDPYCTSGRSAQWEKIIPDSLWQSFIRSKGIAAGTETQIISPPREQPKRTKYYMIADKAVSNEEIRARFNLRSSFFTVTPVADSVIIKGRGYGHGVGLCQDGARVMASRGMTCVEITRFYYPGTTVTDVKNARKPERP